MRIQVLVSLCLSTCLTASALRAEATGLACSQVLSNRPKTSVWNIFGLKFKDPVGNFLDQWLDYIGPTVEASDLAYVSDLKAPFAQFSKVVDALEKNPDPVQMQNISSKFLGLIDDTLRNSSQFVLPTMNNFMVFAEGNALAKTPEEQTKDVKTLLQFIQDVNRFRQLWLGLGLPSARAPQVQSKWTEDQSLYLISLFNSPFLDEAEATQAWLQTAAKPNPRAIGTAQVQTHQLLVNFKKFWDGSFDAKKLVYVDGLDAEITQLSAIADALYGEASIRPLEGSDLAATRETIRLIDKYFLSVLQISISINARIRTLDSYGGHSLVALGNRDTHGIGDPAQTSEALLLYKFMVSLNKLAKTAQIVNYADAAELLLKPQFSQTISGHYYITHIYQSKSWPSISLTSLQKSALNIRD